MLFRQIFKYFHAPPTMFINQSGLVRIITVIKHIVGIRQGISQRQTLSEIMLLSLIV